MIITMGLLGCDSSSNKLKWEKKYAFDKVKIINHTANHYIKKEVVVTKLSAIDLIKKQFKLLKPINNVNLKSNQGLYEIILFNTDSSKNTLDIVFTTYDGVVVFNEDTNQAFKNNGLEELVTNFLN